MEVDRLHAWYKPLELLDILQNPELAPFPKNDQYNEAWVVAQFAKIMLPGEKCEVRMHPGNFPDAELKITSSGYIKPIEITQAFEGGDNSPSRSSQLYNHELYRRIKSDGNFNEDYYDLIEQSFIHGLELAIQKKVAKHYACRPHLLVYINNIPTWGEAEYFIDRHLEQLQLYQPFFASINVLTSDAEHAIQIVPNFRVFSNKFQ